MVRHALLSLSAVVALTLCSVAAAAPEQAAAETPVAAPVDRATLRKQLAAQRKQNLARLHRYRVNRVFPHNTYEEGMLNVWTDAEGHLCAVATMMKAAGQGQLVEATGRDANFVRVADVTSGPLADWVLTSGFTQEEVVMIQQPTDEEVRVMEAEIRREERRIARMVRREDARLERNYIAIERVLKEPVLADAGLDLAVARLEKRPDLIAALHASVTKAVPATKTARE